MNDANQDGASSSVATEMVGLLRRHGRPIAIAASTVGVLIGIFGAVYLLWGQPSRRISVLEFRPTFTGAAEGRYPNKLPFSGKDISDGSILDLVYTGNGLQDYCDREVGPFSSLLPFFSFF